MIQDIGNHKFHNEYRAGQVPRPESRVLFYRDREILVKNEGGQISFLTWQEVLQKCPCPEEATYLFAIDGVSYFLLWEFGEQRGADSTSGRSEPDQHQMPDLFPGFRWERIDLMRTVGPREAAFAGVTGMQLYRWYRSRRFCPACGRRAVHDGRERMMRCTFCGQVEYPKICPAVIVGVTRGDRLLLTKYAGRSFRNYALIAGFAEVGEPIEDTVRREVMEEVGLRVKNIRYYKSQPWSLTDTLLMGFFAEADGPEDIALDESELSEAKWCAREEIPEDDGVSLTREMMGVFKHGG